MNWFIRTSTKFYIMNYSEICNSLNFIGNSYPSLLIWINLSNLTFNNIWHDYIGIRHEH